MPVDNLLSIQIFCLSLEDRWGVWQFRRSDGWIFGKSFWIRGNPRFVFTVAGLGHLEIPFSFPGSMDILPSSMTIPNHSIFVLQNSHFPNLRKRSFSFNRCRTCFVLFSSSSGVFANRKILSMYMITMHPLIKSLKIESIIDWNIAGELHKPKNITVGLNNPLFVLNAAFHWSPSLIQMLLYPQHTSSLVKYLAPANLSVSSEIRGSEYACLMVQSLRYR